jgi:hypothetical protein
MSDDEAMRLLARVVAVLGVAIGLAAPAHADPADTDADFLALLDKVGISYNSPELAISTGRKVCEMMDSGRSGPEVVKAVTAKNPGFTNADRFVAIAVSVYCPNHVAPAGGADDGN